MQYDRTLLVADNRRCEVCYLKGTNIQHEDRLADPSQAENLWWSRGACQIPEIISLSFFGEWMALSVVSGYTGYVEVMLVIV